MSDDLTPRQREGLRWFARQREPVGLFGWDAPSPIIRKRLHEADLIEELPRVNMQLVRFQISAKGKKLVASWP